MQACGGSAIMNSIQQPVGIKTSVFPSNWMGAIGSPSHVKMSSFKPCRSSQLEGSLVTGKPPSSASIPIPEVGGIVHNWLLLHDMILGIFPFSSILLLCALVELVGVTSCFVGVN